MIYYTKICAICGKSFNGKAHNAKYCSSACRKTADRKKYSSKNIACRACGKPLPDSRQQWCIDCLLDDYQKTKSEISFNRLRNRGYDKEMILDEIKNRSK